MSRSRVQPMASRDTGSWWKFALRGLAAALFGLLVVIWPGLALFAFSSIITLLGIHLLIDSIVTIIAAMRSSERRRWLLLIEGILGIVAGLVAVAQPSIAGLALGHE